MRIPWEDRVRNVEVLRRMNKEMEVLLKIEEQTRIQHTANHNVRFKAKEVVEKFKRMLRKKHCFFVWSSNY